MNKTIPEHYRMHFSPPFLIALYRKQEHMSDKSFMKVPDTASEYDQA